MGQPLEFNDTLKINAEQGFPEVLNLEKHLESAITLEDVKDKIFEFEKGGFRVYHQTPTRCNLVQERDGKWINWGEVHLIEQTNFGTSEETYRTRGKFKITKIYPPEDIKMLTKYLAKPGKSYFEN